MLSGSRDRYLTNEILVDICPMYTKISPRRCSSFGLLVGKGGKRNCSVLILCTTVRRKNASMFTTLFTLLPMDLRDIVDNFRWNQVLKRYSSLSKLSSDQACVRHHQGNPTIIEVYLIK